MTNPDARMTAPAETQTLSAEAVAELLRLHEAATPGPWRHTTYMSGTQNVEYPGHRGIAFSDQVLAADASRICDESDAQPAPFIQVNHRPEDKGDDADPQRTINARLIVAAVNALPRLLADRKRLEEERDEARRLHGKLVLDASRQLSAAEAALAASQAEVEGWRTMESAPKDGTQFLAWTEEEGVDFFHWQGENYSCVGWRDSFINVYRENDPNGPRGWRPIPAPPASASDKEAGR